MVDDVLYAVSSRDRGRVAIDRDYVSWKNANPEKRNLELANYELWGYLCVDTQIDWISIQTCQWR